MSDPEQITHVALRVSSGRIFKLPAPARHGDVIAYMATMVAPGATHSATQGFVTKGGEFLNRREGLVVAQLNGQMKRRPPGGYDGNELLSEDLW